MSDLSLLDLGAKLAFVAFFTTAGTTLVMGVVNRRHERRKVLKEQLEKIVADHAATLPLLTAADPNQIVYDAELRAQALSLLVDLRRACLNASHGDCDAVMRSDRYHEVESAIKASRILIEVVRRTGLDVSPKPVWNGSRANFAGPILLCFNLRLSRPK